MAEANDDSSKWKRITSDLRKSLECPVCLEVVKQPFKQCIRGHLVCVTCLNRIKLTSCAMCEGELLLENSICIKNLLDCLPRGCCNSAKGCKEIVQKENEHERYCGFRHVTCKSGSCTKKVLAKDLSLHIKTVHSNVIVIKKHKEGIKWPKFQTTKHYSGLFVNLFDNFFWICLNKNDESQIRITFEAIPVGKLDSDYFARVGFINGDFQCVCTLKAFSAEQNECKFELLDDKGENCNVEEFCVKISNNVCSHFINKDGELVHDLFVFKR